MFIETWQYNIIWYSYSIVTIIPNFCCDFDSPFGIFLHFICTSLAPYWLVWVYLLQQHSLLAGTYIFIHYCTNLQSFGTVLNKESSKNFNIHDLYINKAMQ